MARSGPARNPEGKGSARHRNKRLLAGLGRIVIFLFFRHPAARM
ncbi:hypothetical protein [Paenibacillus sp. R14(2021)]|nr:hypothetical protein [Paenibacillus sp. R14(2021)]